MKSKTPGAGLLAFGLCLSSGLALAHHGDAGRYEEATTLMTGTVVTLQLINPHSSIILDVTDKNGAVVRWQAELGSPRLLVERQGWNKNTLKPGDKIILTGRRVKSGAPYFNLSEKSRIVLAETCEEIYVTRSAPEHPISCTN